MSDYYTILNLKQNASQEEIKKSYKSLALQYHPDRNPGNPAAEELFKVVNEAYQTLSDPTKRAHYDNMLLYNTYSASSTVQNTEELRKRPPRKRPKYHKRSVNYKIDKEYFKIQKIILAIFFIMVGSAYLMFYINNYIVRKQEEAKLLFEMQTIDSLNNFIHKKQYESAINYSTSLIKSYPLNFNYHNKKDSLLRLLSKKSIKNYDDENFNEALRIFKIIQQHDTLQFAFVLDKMVDCFVKTNNTDSAIMVLKERLMKNRDDLRFNYLLSKLYMDELNNQDSALLYINKTKNILKRNLTKMYGEGFEFIIDPVKTPDLYYDLFLLRARINVHTKNYMEAYTDCNWAIFLRPENPEPYLLRIEAGIKTRQPFRVCKDMETLLKMGKLNIDNQLKKYCIKNNI